MKKRGEAGWKEFVKVQGYGDDGIKKIRKKATRDTVADFSVCQHIW